MVVQSQFIEETQRWENEGTIRDLIHNTVEKAGKKFSADSKIRYIDISSVDNGTNTVTGVTEYIFKDAPSRAQQCVRKGDILVSTVRPNLKNIAVNHLDGDDLVASSGFCVLRPKEGCAGLIMAYILSDVFTEKMTLVAKGTNYPAIHDSDILNYKIRLSDDSKVSMIDRLFKQADKSKFDGLKSQFIEMFGDPNANTKNWKTCKVSELFSLQMGKTPSRDNSAYWSSPDHKWISIADLGKYEKFTNVTEESISDEAIQSTGIKIIPKGTVIMSFKLSVGKTAITSEDIYSNEAIVAFIPKDDTYKTEFLYDLVSYYDWLEHAIQAVKGKTLNKESLGVNNLIIPPVDFQKKWICISRQADKSKYLS